MPSLSIRSGENLQTLEELVTTGSFGQYSYDEEPMPQTIGAIMEILSDVQSQLTSLSHGFEEQKKRQVKADAVLKHLSRQ
jgi:hypothetical protein